MAVSRKTRNVNSSVQVAENKQQSKRSQQVGVLGGIKQMLVGLFLGGNLMTILLLWMCCLSTFVDPSAHPRVATAGLFFPILLFANVLFVVFWLIFKTRFALVPLVGMLFCAGYVLDYCPVNFGGKTPNDSSTISVLTWNVHDFMDGDNGERQAAFDYLKNSDADIICLQEAGGYDGIRSMLYDNLSPLGYRRSTPYLGWVVYSRFPFIDDERLPIESERSNGGLRCRLLVNGDTVWVYNLHLECNALTEGDKEEYKDMLRNPEKEKVKRNGLALVGKLAEKEKVRGPQADAVAASLDSLEGQSILLCGDFNDTPISYSYQTVAKRLTNSFREAGNGIGISYNQRAFMVRIDHSFHSSDWEAVYANIDKSIASSDHYPLFVKLRKK